MTFLRPCVADAPIGEWDECLCCCEPYCEGGTRVDGDEALDTSDGEHLTLLGTNVVDLDVVKMFFVKARDILYCCCDSDCARKCGFAVSCG